MPEDWEDTRATLHAYALAVSALPRALVPPDPRWWHTSLEVTPEGLITDPIDLPDGGTFSIRMDLREHEIVLQTSGGDREAWPMDAGLTASELGDELIKTAADLGRDGDYDRDRFESDEPRSYDPAAATAFYEVLEAVAAVFAEHRASLDGEVGPVQMWPHGFDLAFEWFGTRVEGEHAAQINLGFYPAGEPYFYSNPWPFDVDELIENSLPAGCEWYVEDWQGTRLLFAEIEDDPSATERILEFARRVFEIAQPTLTA